jgi:TolB-like protein/Tfp pilus assembly protein PilF
MKIDNFFAELKRRNVYRIAVAYAVVAWLLIQAASIFFPAFDAPPWVMRIFIIAISFGFPVALIFSWAFEFTSDGLKLESQIAPNQSSTQHTGRKIVAFTIAIAVVAAGLFVYQIVRSTSTIAPRSSEAATAISAKSIAVLPFENLSSDKENAYFVEGIQDEIITRLANLRELKVISRTSTTKFKNRQDNLKMVAAELGVANILEGRVQKLANEAHINVQLIKASTDEHLWAQSYDRTLEHSFAVEGEVAQRIADALKLTLAPAQMEKLNELPSQSPQAYDLFLRGEYEYHQAVTASSGSSALARQAATYYEQAVQADPQFSLAYASLARAQLAAYRLATYETGTRDDAAAAKARPNIDRSFQLIPDLALAHLALGEWYLWKELDLSQATKEFQRAIESDPHLTDAFSRIAVVYLRLDKPEKAIEELKAALIFDPRNVILYRTLGAAYRSSGQPKLALESFERAVALEPTDVLEILNAALMYVEQGDLDQAQRLLDTYPADRRTDWIYLEDKLHLLFLQRDYRGMQELLQKVPPNIFPTNWTRFVKEGQAARGLGQTEAALAFFEQARSALTAELQKNPGNKEMMGNLAYVDAHLHRDEAISEAKKVVELTTKEDASEMRSVQVQLGQVYALLGRGDEAIETLEEVLASPAARGLNVGEIEIDPDWDSVRSDPRFQKLCQQKRK